MLEVMKTTLNIYQNYGGDSMMTLLVMAAILYLWVSEERREVKILFVYLVTGIIALFFFPVFSYIAIHFFLDSQVYYRLLWLVPMGMLVAYGAARAVSQIETRRKRIIMSVLFVLFMVRGGSLIYQKPMVTKAENLYHLPPSVIAVADVMHVEDRDVKAVVPSEMLQFIRQYDASILLAYGRDALVDGWNNNPLYEAMEANPVRSYAITDYAKQQGVEYIVLRTGTPVVGTNPINKYEFSYLTTTDNYDIYIYDRAEFAEEKKKEYESLIDPDRVDNYTRTE